VAAKARLGPRGELAEGEVASPGVEDDNAEPFVWARFKASSAVSL
jgi:hypothetical protein